MEYCNDICKVYHGERSEEILKALRTLYTDTKPQYFYAKKG